MQSERRNQAEYRDKFVLDILPALKRADSQALGCFRCVVTRREQRLAVPTSRDSYPGMGFRETCFPHPILSDEVGGQAASVAHQDEVAFVNTSV